MRFSVLLLATLCPLSAVPMAAQRTPNPNYQNSIIQVQVRYKNGGAAPGGIMVTLENEGAGITQQTQTDSQGKASFRVAVAGFYVVSIRQPGYQPMSERVDLNMNPTAYVNFELQAERGANPIPPGGPLATISASIPENAAKEFRTGEKLLNEKKDQDGAIKHFRKAIDMHNAFPEAYLMLGLIYLDQKKFEDSQTALQKSAELDPKSGAAYLALGAVLNQERKYEDAEKALNRGLEIAPDASEGQYELAKAYWALGRWQEAEPHAQKAVAAHPDLAPIHVLLGNIALRKNDPQGALKEFQEYLRLDPKGPMADGSRAMVEKIRKASAKPQ
ncbi:MAG TPA: tetratricopeptide repeat protein [Terriglobales bacterium]|nr:tetratricopeptide repeat protein [Terriglobales bacterium]